MNDSDTNHTDTKFSDQIDALRRQAFVLLLALIVISGTLATYLRYQSVVMGKTLDGIRPQATQTIQIYNQVNAHINQASLTNFVNQISAYAVTHPDFQPILKKYGWTPPAANSAPIKK